MKPLDNLETDASASHYYRTLHDYLRDDLPWLSFPEHWEVCIIPPSGGAAIRFLVKHRGRAEQVSVYLDATETLGCPGQVYWEIYPAADGDTARFWLAETPALLTAIENSLAARELAATEGEEHH